MLRVKKDSRMVFPDEFEHGDGEEQLDDQSIDESLLNRPYGQHSVQREGLDHRRAIGRAAVAATLAATLVTPSAALAAQITEPDPVPIVQVIQLDDPPDQVQAAVADDDQDKSKSGLSFFKKLLLGFAVIVFLLLMFLITRCAASLLGIGAPITDGSGAGDEAGYAVSVLIDDSVARENGHQLEPIAVSVSDQRGSAVLAEHVVVGYGESVTVCTAEPGEYRLTVLADPAVVQDTGSSEGASDAAVEYRIVPGSQAFSVRDGDVLLELNVLAVADGVQKAA